MPLRPLAVVFLSVVALVSGNPSVALAKPTQKEVDVPASVTHDDAGFELRTADGAFALRLFGIVQADFRDYVRKADRTDYERFLVRRARPYLEGHVMRNVDLRLMTDFGNGEVQLLDAFLDVRLFDRWVRFRAGKYKQPFSYEQFKMEDLTLAVFERSALDILAPARNVGAMVHGSDPDGIFE
jgi:phosphate-selective porin OprO/OprP